MAHKEFIRDINGQSRLRVFIVTTRGEVRQFTVQLETLIKGNWTPVARYDTAHGFAHLDILHPRGRQKKLHMQETDLNKALEIAFTDFLTNAESYIGQYMKEV